MKHIFFDLDGTLLPMEVGVFGRGYFEGLTRYFAQYGYEPNTFMEALKVSVYSMFENDGSRTNEELFFEKFLPVVNKTREECQPLMDVFYTEHFPNIVKETCGYNEKAKEAIRILKDKGYKVYILTNPLFPPLATETRIKHAGINLDDVSYVTTYDNSTYAKPNPKYYEEVMNKFGRIKTVTLAPIETLSPISSLSGK